MTAAPEDSRSRALRALHDWAIANRNTWPAEDAFDRVLRLTFASATEAVGAISVLTERGYGADALKLCRSLVESLLVGYWAAYVPEPSWVVMRMDEHRDFAALVLFDVLQEHSGWIPDGEHVEPPERAVVERERLSEQYGRYCQESWWAIDVEQRSDGRWKQHGDKRSLRTLVTDLVNVPELEGRLWQEANPDDADDEDEADRAPTPFIQQMLDIPNRFNNQVLHHSPAGLASYASLGHEGYVFDDETSDKWVPQAQALAYVAFSLLTQLMIDRYAPDLRESFDEQLDPLFAAAFVTLTAEQSTYARRGANRNKLCPCGSGLKCKKCHGSIAP